MTTAKITMSICALALVASCSQNEEPSSTPRAVSPQQVAELSEPAIGLDETFITPQNIKVIENGLREDAAAKLKNNMQAAGDYREVPLLAASQLTNHQGERAVVTSIVIPKIDDEGSAVIKHIWWIQDQQLKRVVCSVINTDDFNALRGKCGQQISSTFGYKNWSLPE